MCSIAGSDNRERTEKMLEAMKHRSPDGYKAIADEKFSIGMGRLAIVDSVSEGLFPYKEDNYILAFNGEIYNYKELRRLLEARGHWFRTKSDTEVLLKAYKEWGIKCLDKLNGMFAFAIYDGSTITLARDLAGEKPLYFSRRPFAFASEAKALNWQCEEFPPASYGIYDFTELTINRWWEFRPRQIALPTAYDELESLIADSIKLRTKLNVPYGLYLSGGIDSSLIATFHNFENIFTYEDGNYKDDFNENLEKIVYHLDYPISSFSPYGLWRLAREASQKVKVVISGEGADELFGGYIRYLKPHFEWCAKLMYPSYGRMFQSAKNVNDLGFEEFNGNLRELLRQGDRMASAFGLENRSPFLDRRIVEFAFSLPDNYKISGWQTKHILREILRRRNPLYVFGEKHGLFCSVNEWLGVFDDEFSKEKYLEVQNDIWKKFQSL